MLPHLDWKRSAFYQDYAVKKLYCKGIFEQRGDLFKEDELDYIKSMVKNRVHGVGPFSDEVKLICKPFIQKGLNTLEFICKEVLQEESWHQEDD